MRTARELLRGALTAMRGRLVIVLALLVGLYFVVGFGGQAWKARQLQIEVAQQQAAIARLQTQHARLQQAVEEDNSPKYLADVEVEARGDLGLSHPGETVLLVRWDGAAPVPALATSTTPTPSPSAEQPPNWRKWLDLFH